MPGSQVSTPKPCFFDTNILIYATIDQDAEKQRHAATLIARAIAEGEFAISAQVLKEFANTLVKKSDKTFKTIRQTVERFSPYAIVADTPALVLKALDIQNAHGLQFFDALLEKANVVGTPGEGFGENGKGYFRLTAFGSYENTLKACGFFKTL